MFILQHKQRKRIRKELEWKKNSKWLIFTLNCFSKTIKWSIMKTLWCVECRWRSLKFGTLWYSQLQASQTLLHPSQHCSVWSSCRVRRAEEALVQGKHCVGLCTGGMKHDLQNTTHECCFSSWDGKNGLRSAVVPKQSAGCG